jgi:hypothetical protein
MTKMIKLDGGEVVWFGQSLREIEELYSCKAIQGNLRYSRKGIDMIIKLKNVLLEFDSGRLKVIEFTHPYEFVNSLAPYKEQWKNLDPVDGTGISGGMSRVHFISYLRSWEERAKELGAKSCNFDDLFGNQYLISFEKNTFRDMIHVSLGPSRRTGGRGRWSDGWTFFFTIDSVHKMADKKPGVLESISCFRDEFNTVARAQTGIIGQ